VNSLCFSKNSEFICAGLDDGLGKIWNLQTKGLVANLAQPATSRYTSENAFAPLTAISLNCNNQICATSNKRGVINLYRTETVFDPIENSGMQNIAEYSQILADQSYSGSINQI